jgi:hypothetical protein
MRIGVGRIVVDTIARTGALYPGATVPYHIHSNHLNPLADWEQTRRYPP